MKTIHLSARSLAVLASHCPAVLACSRPAPGGFDVFLLDQSLSDLESLCVDGETVDTMLLRTDRRTIQ